MKRNRCRKICQNLLLVFGSLVLCFIVTEAAYRILDPYPFFDPADINRTEYGNLSTYDPLLGWKGVPSASVRFTTNNSSTRLALNSEGFRDIEHGTSIGSKPAIIFLGDSFAWGYEVEFDEMFVNLLREKLPGYEIFNLSHRGYGTDQELLVFRDWREKQPIKLVVLMFFENDVGDNNSDVRNNKPKPKFQVVDDQLELTGVPVPKDERWDRPPERKAEENFWRATAKKIFFPSHFLHDLFFRVSQFFVQHVKEEEHPDLTLTIRILEELKKEVEDRGARFVLAFIPSRLEVDKPDSSPPYQAALKPLCRERGIEYLDLAPAFRNRWFRTYYRNSIHWNPRGQGVAAEVLGDYLREVLNP